jgi:hypothetical protein
MNTKLMFGVVITAVALSAGMDTALAGGGKKLSPVGAWQVQVTPYNCATNADTAPAFDSLLTFHADGTLTETTSNRSFQPGQRSVGLGYWEKTDRDFFRAVFHAYVQYDSVIPAPPAPPPVPVYKRGVQTVDQGIQMPDRDHFSGNAKVTFRDVNGTIVPPPVPPPGQPVPQGCARFEGTRME